MLKSVIVRQLVRALSGPSFRPIRNDYHVPDLDTSAGVYSLDLFGSRAIADLHSGRTLVVRDVAAELGLGDGREMFQSLAAALMEARLAPDMRPLPAQYQMASDSAKNALARLTGTEACMDVLVFRLEAN